MKTNQDRAYLQILPAEVDQPSRSISCENKDNFRSIAHLTLVQSGLMPASSQAALSVAAVVNPARRLSQQLLLPLPDPGMIIIVNMTLMTTPEFVRFLETVRPRHLLDMRLCPVFTIDHWMSNQKAFTLFEKVGARYDNIALFLELKFGVKSDDDARLNPAIVAALLPKLRTFFPKADFPWPLQGPLAFLVDDPIRAVDYEAQMPSFLKPAPTGGWHALIMGHSPK